MPNARIYWICQFAAWGLYALLNTTLLSMYMRFPPAAIAGLMSYGLAGVAVTHGLRYWIQRSGLLARRWQTILWQVLLAIPLGSIVLTAVIMLFYQLFVAWSMKGVSYSLSSIVFGTLFNMHFLIALWLAIYISVHMIWSNIASRQAQLQALEAQINPHFLFNSLNGLRGLILEDPHAAQEMVTRLAQLLRYSLHQSRRSTVPLSEEIEAVRDYLAIEGIRFEDRLRVQWQLDPKAEGQAVPPMSLQTLVENALKHGIAHQPQGGEIHISTQCSKAGLVLGVSNPGRLGTNSSSGTGLKNLSSRLRLLHGELAQLRLEQEGPRVKASIQLPCAQ
jgi:two-component system, LytTR family, sensor kinase